MLVNAKDVLWKGIIEGLFSDFLRFFYEDADELFDMEKGFVFLDKELGELYPGVDIHHPKFVDKLVKVYRKNGAEKLLLIHIEVQGYYDKFFTRRMFTYFCRILDRFDMEVSSIAIFTDNDKNYCPAVYEYDSLGTSNIFRFKTYKIKGQDKAVLEDSDNPFAIVVLTVLIAMENGGDYPEKVLNLSLELVKRLFRKGFNKVEINRLIHFIGTYVYFDNREMFANFERGIESFTNKEKSMGIEELAAQLIREAEVERVVGPERASFVTNLLLKSNHSLQEIAEFANTSVDYVIDIKNKLAVVEK